MLSAPPASAKSASPIASACTAETIACAPEPHSRFTFIAGTVSGTPASIAATRLRYMSRGSVLITWPKTTCPICPPSTPGRSSAARAAMRRERDRRRRREASAEGADGGARPVENHDVAVHGRPPRSVRRDPVPRRDAGCKGGRAGGSRQIVRRSPIPQKSHVAPRLPRERG